MPPRFASVSCRCACRGRNRPAEAAAQGPPGSWWPCWRSSSGSSSTCCSSGARRRPPSTDSREKSPRRAQTASSGNIALDSKGYIMPVQRILVSPKVSGMIVKLDILEGRRVKKGADSGRVGKRRLQGRPGTRRVIVGGGPAAAGRNRGHAAERGRPGQGRVGADQGRAGAVEVRLRALTNCI